MGRTSKHLRYSVVSVKPLKGKRVEKTLASFWAPDINHLSLDSVNASTTEQCPKSLHYNFDSRGGTSLDCKMCEVYNWRSKFVKPSQYESAAYKAISSLPAELQVAEQEILIDHKLLGGELSAVDIYLPSLNLCIMVDGEGHFSSHHCITAQRQEEIDHKFNTQAIRAGHKILRLHFEDAGLYTSIVRAAVDRCRKGIFGSIDFSKSYGQINREAWGLKPLV